MMIKTCLLLLMCTLASTHTSVAPACSGSRCYLCSNGNSAAILNGNACSCADGTRCELVSGSSEGAAVVPPVILPNNLPGGAKPTGASSSSGAECRQSAPGEGGSRCGYLPDGRYLDLIGYCEDECGSGDFACCEQDDKGEWIPNCNGCKA